MTASQSPRWRIILSTTWRFALGATLIGWAVWQLDWVTLAQSVRQIQLYWVVAALVSFLLSLFLKLIRWRWLLKQLVPHIGWLTLARAAISRVLAARNPLAAKMSTATSTIRWRVFSRCSDRSRIGAV